MSTDAFVPTFFNNVLPLPSYSTLQSYSTTDFLAAAHRPILQNATILLYHHCSSPSVHVNPTPPFCRDLSTLLYIFVGGGAPYQCSSLLVHVPPLLVHVHVPPLLVQGLHAEHIGGHLQAG